MADVIFKKGLSTNLNKVEQENGQILVAEDTGEMYIDNYENKRIKITDTSKVNISQLKTINGSSLIITDPNDSNIAINYEGSGPDLNNYVTKVDTVGKKTDNQGEIFNLYENTEETIGSVGGINYGKQTAPKNEAGQYAHAEGVSTAALGKGSHAEGAGMFVTGAGSHGEGRGIRFNVVVETINGSTIIVKPIIVMEHKIIPSSEQLRAAEELNSIKKNAVIWYETNNSSNEGYFYYVLEATPYEQETIGITGIASYSYTKSYQLLLNKTDNIVKGAKLTIIMGSALSFISHTEGNYCNTVDIESTNFYSNEKSGNQRQHAEGSRTLVTGYAGHAEGEYSLSMGNMAHAEGKNTQAIGNHSHTEGNNTKATGDAAHAEGEKTIANGNYSHAGGLNTIANNDCLTAIGKYNFPTILRKLTFTINEKTTQDHLRIRVGNFSGNNDAIAKLSFFNPRLTYNGKDIINPMTSDYFITTSEESGKWMKKGTVTIGTRNDGYKVFDNVATNAYARAEYYQSGVTLEPGIYTLSIMYYLLDGDIQSLAQQNILTMQVLHANKDISSNGTYEEVKTLFNIGNANNDSNRSNAFEVYADGHAEVQSWGDSDNSVVTNSRFKFYKSETEIPSNLPAGTIVFIVDE